MVKYWYVKQRFHVNFKPRFRVRNVQRFLINGKENEGIYVLVLWSEYRQQILEEANKEQFMYLEN